MCRSTHTPEPQNITPMFRYEASQKLTSLQRTYARAVAKARSLTPKNGETTDFAFATIVFAFSLCGGFKSHHSSLMHQLEANLPSKPIIPLSTFSLLAKKVSPINLSKTFSSRARFRASLLFLSCRVFSWLARLQPKS